MNASAGIARSSSSVTKRGSRRTKPTSTHHHFGSSALRPRIVILARAIELRRVGMRRRDDLADAGDPDRLGAGVVEEREVADSHLAHEVARREVAHARPFLAPDALEVVDREGVGFGLEQPMARHARGFSAKKKEARHRVTGLRRGFRAGLIPDVEVQRDPRRQRRERLERGGRAAREQLAAREVQRRFDVALTAQVAAEPRRTVEVEQVLHRGLEVDFRVQRDARRCVDDGVRSSERRVVLTLPVGADLERRTARTLPDQLSVALGERVAEDLRAADVEVTERRRRVGEIDAERQLIVVRALQRRREIVPEARVPGCARAGPRARSCAESGR